MNGIKQLGMKDHLTEFEEEEKKDTLRAGHRGWGVAGGSRWLDLSVSSQNPLQTSTIPMRFFIYPTTVFVQLVLV